MTITWPMIVVVSAVFSVCTMLILRGLVRFLRAIERIILSRVDSHVLSVQKQVDRVVALADAADSQYRSLKIVVDNLRKDFDGFRDEVVRDRQDIMELKRRIRA